MNEWILLNVSLNLLFRKPRICQCLQFAKARGTGSFEVIPIHIGSHQLADICGAWYCLSNRFLSTTTSLLLKFPKECWSDAPRILLLVDRTRILRDVACKILPVNNLSIWIYIFKIESLVLEINCMQQKVGFPIGFRNY